MKQASIVFQLTIWGSAYMLKSKMVNIVTSTHTAAALWHSISIKEGGSNWSQLTEQLLSDVSVPTPVDSLMHLWLVDVNYIYSSDILSHWDICCSAREEGNNILPWLLLIGRTITSRTRVCVCVCVCVCVLLLIPTAAEVFV
jgi:hypothetical protein